MLIEISKDSKDDPMFLDLLTNLVRNIVSAQQPTSLRVIRVAKWFDHKWLRFSGIGRVRFDAHLPSWDVALDSFSSDELTFPPFTPKRILAEECWKLADATYEKYKPQYFVHPRRLRHSSYNLHRRIVQFARKSIYVWFSSLTAENDSAAIMVYVIDRPNTEAWYVSLRKSQGWVLYKTKGISLDVVEKIIQAPTNRTA